MKKPTTPRTLAALSAAGLVALASAGTALAATASTDRPALNGIEQADDSTTSTTPDPPADAERADEAARRQLTEALSDLVADGTLTEEQVTAIVTSIIDSGLAPMPAGPMGPGFDDHRGGPIGPGPHHDPADAGPRDGPTGDRHGPRAAGDLLDVVAETIGVDVSDVVTALADGTTIAALAEQEGVDVQTVVDAVVSVVSDRLDERVMRGELTEQERTQRIDDATARITDWINGDTTHDDHTVDASGPTASSEPADAVEATSTTSG